MNLKTLTKKKDNVDYKEHANYSGNPGKSSPIKANLIPKLELRNLMSGQNCKYCSISKKLARQGLEVDANRVNIERNEKENAQKVNANININVNVNVKEENTKNSKIQVAIENMLKNKYKLFYNKANVEAMKEEDLMDFNLFYLKELNNRLLYHDAELQVLMVSLVICLLITPTRGTLDELYCSSMPYESNKMNILFLLHHHLNHSDNQHIIPSLMPFVSEIHPHGAGQRLLKLLCTTLFDPSVYTDWSKIAVGAYGEVYQCSTQMADPSIVAIKKIKVAKYIFDRCNLFDTFTEITALETFRMDGCVTHLFDYGLDADHYYIVMKRYQQSLRTWRVQQTLGFSEMLAVYLNIFRDILKAVSVIHNAKTTHYDLKCDNVVIEYINASDGSSIGQDNFDYSAPDEHNISVKIADFGECRMFLNEQDEHCSRSRGTNVIKSPEMLINTGIQARRDDDDYDRRKKIGTTRSSDIWSLGCLFYELLTGNFLFEEDEPNYCKLMKKTNTLTFTDLLTPDKLALLNNNPYIIDFLKFMLVRDQNYRPNVDSILKRFEHVHALLVNVGSVHSSHHMIGTYRKLNINTEQALEVCNDMLTSTNYYLTASNEPVSKIKTLPSLIKITEDIYLAEFNYAENNYNRLCSLGITHVISWTKTKQKDISEKILFLNILETAQDLKRSVFFYLSKVMDFLRHCMVYRGSVLFIDDYCFNNTHMKPNCLMRSLIVLSVSNLLQLSAYDAWTYLNSKLLFFWVPPEDLSQLSTWVLNQSAVYTYILSFPTLRCLCGACVIVLKRIYSSSSNIQSRSCTCSSRYNNTEFSECCSPGCYEYMQDVKVSKNQILTKNFNFRMHMALCMNICNGASLHLKIL